MILSSLTGMRISVEQQRLLDSLSCERLSSNEVNLRLVDDFENHRNPRIAEALQGDAYEEDECGKVAYYVVKNAKGKILFYFSLKCGLLFDEFVEVERLRQLKDVLAMLVKKRNDSGTSDEEKTLIDSLLEQVRSKKGLKKMDLAKVLHKPNVSESLDNILDAHTTNVGQTFAGVEIVHFCANDKYRSYWKDSGIGQKLGVVVFWKFLVPKVTALMKLVGCEYLFLFAADNTENLELVNYYNYYFQFKRSEDHSTAIPLYDFTCKFMYQKTIDLEQRRLAFFDNFNREESY